MEQKKRIHSALVSVFSKDGLEPIIRKMNQLGISLYSTGGTEDFIKKLGVEVIPVESITDYPSIFGGRVKTLHQILRSACNPCRGYHSVSLYSWGKGQNTPS